jgi:hypothetical protein
MAIDGKIFEQLHTALEVSQRAFLAGEHFEEHKILLSKFIDMQESVKKVFEKEYEFWGAEHLLKFEEIAHKSFKEAKKKKKSVSECRSYFVKNLSEEYYIDAPLRKWIRESSLDFKFEKRRGMEPKTLARQAVLNLYSENPKITERSFRTIRDYFSQKNSKKNLP